jgi:hypothetical protein
LLSQVTENDLRAVQRRRQFPTRATQKMQLLAQKRLIGRVLAGREQLKAPLLLRLASRRLYVKRLAARIIGLGFRPEHVNVPAARS